LTDVFVLVEINKFVVSLMKYEVCVSDHFIFTTGSFNFGTYWSIGSRILSLSNGMEDNFCYL